MPLLIHLYDSRSPSSTGSRPRALAGLAEGWTLKTPCGTPWGNLHIQKPQGQPMGTGSMPETGCGLLRRHLLFPTYPRLPQPF